MDSLETELRRRPVVLDTGELAPAPRRSGRVARAAAGVAVGVLLGAGAIAAGGWSVMTAAQGSTASGQQSPLWYPTPPQVGGSPDGTPAVATTPAVPTPSPVAVIKPAARRTHTVAATKDDHGGSSTGRRSSSGSSSSGSSSSGSSSSGSSSSSPEPSASADRHGGSGSGSSGKSGGETESGDDHGGGGHGSDD